MSRLPLVAIIGRPNTGKSTLFNRLTRSRNAIVSDIPGTTRDHVAQRVDDAAMSYLLIDTGGIGGGSEDHDLEDNVSAQSLLALSAADLILFTVNAQEDLTASDLAVADILRKKRRRHVPVIVVATKCDTQELLDTRSTQYHELGIADEIVGVSAIHAIGIESLTGVIADRLAQLHFTPQAVEAADATHPRIAMIGKPNVGKSSLINALMSEPQRQASARLVSDIPGTTRDASDVVIRHDERDYIFVDTAGMRRSAKVEQDLEGLSVLKSIQALEDSDVVVLVLDATQPVSKQDKRIANLAVTEGKGLIIVVNKTDAITNQEKEERARDIAMQLAFCRFAPVQFVSAHSREGLLKIFPLIHMVVTNRLRRIPVRELRRWYEAAVQRVPARVLSGSMHLTQAEDPPPTFVLFVSKPSAIPVSNLRYLDNSIRETFGFEGTPIRWVTRSKQRDEE